MPHGVITERMRLASDDWGGYSVYAWKRKGDVLQAACIRQFLWILYKPSLLKRTLQKGLVATDTKESVHCFERGVSYVIQGNAGLKGSSTGEQQGRGGTRHAKLIKEGCRTNVTVHGCKVVRFFTTNDWVKGSRGRAAVRAVKTNDSLKRGEGEKQTADPS